MKYFQAIFNTAGKINTKLVVLIFILMFVAFIVTGYEKAKMDSLALESSKAYQQSVLKAQKEYKQVSDSAIVVEKQRSEEFEKLKNPTKSP
jgi:hypothetical protein